MVRLRFTVIIIACASVLLVCGRQGAVFGASQADAVSAMANAKARLIECYEAVAAANAESANITALLVRLNQAGYSYSRAELAYSVGDFAAAVLLAGESSLTLEGVVAEAEALTERAVRVNYLDFLVNVVGSSIGAVGVVCAGVAVWHLSKKTDSSR